MNSWELEEVAFKYQLSDWTFFTVSLRLQCRYIGLFDETHAHSLLVPPVAQLMEGSEGFVIRALPIKSDLPAFNQSNGYVCYVPLQYQHCYIDLTQSFVDYPQKFSSKTRSTIRRKVKKYAQHCGGTISWKTFAEPDEMRDFLRLAREVSILTYQERLVAAGIPEGDNFVRKVEHLAGENRVRAYILFDSERPVSYLYSYANDGVLIYGYLGYDPDYSKLSVGTVLHWLALEQIFAEGCFRAFDFTGGYSDHKRLFATNQRRCANVFLVKGSLRNKVVIYSHHLTNRFSKFFGAKLERLGVKAKMKRVLRFGWSRR